MYVMGEHCAWSPPLLGQQTDDVLSEIGMSPEKIDELRRAHVVDWPVSRFVVSSIKQNIDH
jgi:hypothetical protein